MIRVMIVDDEFLVRVGIKSVIDWRNHGFDVVAEADNGLDALEILRKQPIDIVLLDIEMPKMNGLELLEHLKAEKIQPKVIILSSHNDFEYARRAMKMGCIDYILKLSIEPVKLLELLQTVGSELLKQKQVNIENENQQVNTFINCLKNNDIVKHELCSKVLKKTKDEDLVAISIYVDDVVNESVTGNRKVINTSLINIVYAAINDFSTGDCFELDPGHIMGVVNIYNKNQSNLIELGTNIQKALNGYMEITVSMGIGVIAKGYSGLGESFNLAEKVCAKRFFLGRNSLISYSKSKTKNVAPIIFSIEMEDEFKAAVEFGDKEKAISIVRAYFNQAKQYGDVLEKQQILNDINSIIYICEREFKYHNCKIEELDCYSNEIDLENYKNSVFMDDLFDKLIQFLDMYFKHLLLLRNKVIHTDIRNAIDYVHAHYQEDLSVTLIAKHFNMSSSYFGTLFKKEHGESFNSYLTNYRINQSKKLLRTTQLSISETAEAVGYENVYYFSNVFKKVLGVSPMVYKKEIMENME